MQTKRLLIDAGNSRIKWGLSAGETIALLEPIATAKLSENLKDQTPEQPESIWISNVAGPSVETLFTGWAKQKWDMQPQFVKSCTEAFGVSNAYEKPERLGVDRWVCMIAAHHESLSSVCIADCGTAITIDCLDAQGMHLGGLIAPGLNLMQNALIQGTEGLRSAQGDYPGFFAKNTASAILGGTLQAAAGLIERSFVEAQNQLRDKPLLILTGGDAPLISTQLKIPHQQMADLVLKGLLAIARNDR